MRLFPVVVLTALASAASPSLCGDESTTDAEGLQGTWEVVAMTLAGRPASEVECKVVGISFGGEKMQISTVCDHEEYSFTLDPTKKPKRIFLVDDRGGSYSAIYELKGDELRLCLSDRYSGKFAEDCPTEFAVPEGSRISLFILKRSNIAPDANKDVEGLQGTWEVVEGAHNGDGWLGFVSAAYRFNVKGKTILISSKFGNPPEPTDNLEWCFKIDTTKDPKAIYFADHHSKFEGSVLYGIYELNGDILRICISEDLKGAPAEFSAEEGSGRIVMKLKRTIPSEIIGEVVGAKDGETLTIRVGQQRNVDVRLFGIDAPERSQAFGTQAWKRLGALMVGKTVTVKTTGADSDNRILGEVFAPAELANVNLMLVSEGLAWHDIQFAKDRQDIQEAESMARRTKSGLWSDPNPVAPWQFKKAQAEKAQARKKKRS
ncbi:MAG: TIGR03067 domain-containing protein [Planctomycetota bacterium]